jgi:acyl-CoA hydrolase
MPPVSPASPAQAEVWAAAATRRAARLAKRAAARAAPDAQPPRLRPVTHREGSPTLAPPVRAPPPPPPRHPASGGGGLRSSLDLNPPPLPLLAVPPSATRAHMTQLVLPQHANSLGITFGGQVMRWMEHTAYIAASRVAGRGGHTHLLTAAMDGVAFAAPSRVGDVLYVSAQVTAIWGASMEVMVSVCAETPALGSVFECGDAFVTVVVVQRASGAPAPVPFCLAVPEAGPDAVRAAGAAERRDERLAMRTALRAHDARRPSLDGTRGGGGGGMGWGGVRAVASGWGA